jgi:lipopolysaccharide/colanic/teichoic acid biosynthesis glycosyltransferase
MGGTIMGTLLQLNESVEPLVDHLRQGQWLDAFVRRSIDIFASILGLVVLSPVFLLVALFLRRDSPGPVFFRGSRLGKNGKPFGILKFRTMYELPASYAGPHLTENHDTRITPFGRWLRETKLNELPQLWNVLLGEMSLVGPRPEDPELALAWSDEIRDEILSVRPGITSPASIAYRDEEKILSSNHPVEDYLRKILPSKTRLDVLYIRQRTIINDLDVIFLTFAVLLPVLRKHSIPERLLYQGPLFSFFGRFFNWFVIDWMISLCAVGFSGLIWRLSGPINLGLYYAAFIALVISAIFTLVNFVLRVNRIAWRTARAVSAVGLGLSAGLATLFLLIVNLFSPFFKHILSSEMIALIGMFAFSGFLVARYRERLITGVASRWLDLRQKSTRLGERVVIIGAGQLGEFVAWVIGHGEFANAFHIVGFLDDDLRKQDLMISERPVLGFTNELPHFIRKFDVGVIIFAISNIQSNQQDRILSICRQTPAKLVFFPDVLQMMRMSLLPEYTPFQPNQRDDGPGVIPSPGTDLPHVIEELDFMIDHGDIAAVHNRLHELRGLLRIEENNPN